MAKQEEEWGSIIDPHKIVIKKFIARGTYGMVYEGLYNVKQVAVKLVDWGDETRLPLPHIASLRTAVKQEASVWYHLDHPNVSKLIGAVTDISEEELKGRCSHSGMPMKMCCFVTDYYPGGTLKSYLWKRKRRLPFKKFMQFALQLARGLSYLHSKNIVHRDVKTDNVLLDKNRTLKITDFGVSRIQALNPNEMTGGLGTFGYMAPEVFCNKPYDKKSDVYSFGICLWEIYCCSPAYGSITFSKFTAVVYENLRPEIPRNCPVSLVNLMRRCWETDPWRRPDMEEVVSILEAIHSTEVVGQKQPKGCFCWNL
ncbi:serine/threonine-protein kinase STY13-like [Mercurialis annua]|uniref:serine/threonine-protein kinase STY13-like n=1 Tax=Mercurialis annua TaxID=3986 RepID=UPI00215E259E|nr:serine/threonine-protein kinase STY13-like [Mercurialis annua]